jgi:hypothetical protein
MIDNPDQIISILQKNIDELISNKLEVERKDLTFTEAENK